ncbi:MAG: FAD-binding oxidoreductase [Leptolyngbyaceae cyanobacterium CSU_1_4]|nr:FAD-binding oxidoreductase [Leptolyngbyaceae cyanobacterium CSU_1_4]
MSGIAKALESIIGLAGVKAWESLADEEQPLAGISKSSRFATALAPKSSAQCIAYPKTSGELAEVLACAHANHWRVLPCGQGTKLHWGGLAEIDLVVSTARLNRLIDHAIGDLTVTAEAGMRLADLQMELAKGGQFLAIDPSYASTATLGGIVATGDTGALRQRYGGIRDMLIGLSLVRSDGAIAKAGGRVVKNVAGYDLMKLFTGSYGTLGILSQVTFRIYPLPAAAQTVMLQGNDEAIAQATQTLLASALTPTAIALLPAPTMELDTTGLLVRFQNIGISVEQQADRLLQVGEALGLKGQAWAGTEESQLWQQLQEQIETHTSAFSIACKIGVLPSKAVETLARMKAIAPTIGCIYAGSGLGMLRFSDLTAPALLKLRDLCQAQGGFLTVLEAPIALKQSLDIWGYSGNALDLMQKIKTQFDPSYLLSPRRFVGGI